MAGVFVEPDVSSSDLPLRMTGPSTHRRNRLTSSPCSFGRLDVSDVAIPHGRVHCFSQEALSELVQLLEKKSGKTEILRFLTFRLDFNE